MLLASSKSVAGCWPTSTTCIYWYYKNITSYLCSRDSNSTATKKINKKIRLIGYCPTAVPLQPWSLELYYTTNPASQF